jgi:hypothetical protein
LTYLFTRSPDSYVESSDEQVVFLRSLSIQILNPFSSYPKPTPYGLERSLEFRKQKFLFAVLSFLG